MKPAVSTDVSRCDYTAFDLVVMAASVGGLSALSHVLAVLPAGFPAAIALVQHLSPTHQSHLHRILSRAAQLPVVVAETGTALTSGTIYVAPPDRHFLIQPNRTAILTLGPPVRFSRPAADPLFVSAASTYGARTLGVVLTGANTDGAAGVQAIKWSGGMVLAQDRATSAAYGMPGAAMATGCVDLSLPLEAIGPAIVALTQARGAADFFRVPVQAA
jgi:two-component system chemotaxis response regulator CheB